jgi:4-hydroxy-tetrahydrodipicolinate synthase
MSAERRVGKFQGAVTALVTPFGPNGEVDKAAFVRLLRYQLGNGISALVVGGTTGEGPTLHRDEMLDLVELACREADGRVPVIAGCGTNDTAKAIELTRVVRERGADAGLSVVPYYNRPSQEGLYRHFSAIAAQGGLPVILYNVPGRTGANLAPATVARLARDPMIVGIKEASGSLAQVEEIISSCPPDFSVLSGDDGLTFSIMALGGCGVVSVTSNILPAQVSRLVAALLSTRMDEALRLHRHLEPLTRALFIDTNPVPVKEAFAILGFDVGRPRLPLVELEREKRERLAEVLGGYEEEYRSGWSSADADGGR